MTLRVVLDTNVVVSALLFAKGRLTWIRQAWTEGRFLPLTCRAASDELIRVLSYPKFGLESDQIKALLGDYLPYAVAVEVEGAAGTPRTSDPHDQVFVDLAVVGGAGFVVTGDRALLATPAPVGVGIVTPDGFRATFGRRDAPFAVEAPRRSHSRMVLP